MNKRLLLRATALAASTLLLAGAASAQDFPPKKPVTLVVGFAAGEIPAIKINLPLIKGASLVGVFWGDFARREPAANAAMMQTLATWYAQGKIKPVIDRQMPMSELKAAYARMGSREVMGKLVLVNEA